MRFPFTVHLTASALFFICATALIADNEPSAKQKHHLKYQFQPGETLRWDVLHRATIKTTIQGTTQTAWTSSDSVKVWKIDEVTPEGDAVLTHSVERVKMVNQVSGRAKVEWDSEKDDAPPAGFQQAAENVGVPLTRITMSPYGEIIERKNLVVRPGENDMPITLPLPKEPVAVGHTWHEPHDVRLGLKSGGETTVKTRRRFKLESVKTGVAVISVDYQLLTPIRDPNLEAQLVQRLTKGEIRFDVDAGRVLAQQQDVDRRVYEFSGPSSLMHYLMRFTEKLQTEPAKTATKEAGSSQK